MGKITQNIVNSCNPKKGIEPLAYYAMRKDVAFVLSDRTITSLSCFAGILQAVKFNFNAGHEIVSPENQCERFKHKFTATINEPSITIDEMDDVVLFVRESGATDYKVYGLEQGLWKSAQSGMSNDNYGTTSVELSSREGMEEAAAWFDCSATLVNALPKADTYEYIGGLSILKGEKIALTVQAGKTVYYQLDNDTPVSGVEELINANVSKAAEVKLFIQRSSNVLKFWASGGNASQMKGTVAIDSSIATVNAAFTSFDFLRADNCTTFNVDFSAVKAFSAKTATNVNGSNNAALDAQSIYNAMDNAYSLGVNGGTLNFGGTTVAIDGALISPVHGISYDSVIDGLVNSYSWTVTYNSL